MIDPSKKILSLTEAVEFRKRLKEENKSLVITNGCFDILHRGHANYLYDSAGLGDALMILINSDRSVQELKGPERPIVSQYNRAYMLASLESVSAVVIFDGVRCAKELATIAPDIYVKGGDYTEDSLDKEEYNALKEANTKIYFKPFVDGFSTSDIVRKIKGNS